MSSGVRILKGASSPHSNPSETRIPDLELEMNGGRMITLPSKTKSFPSIWYFMGSGGASHPYIDDFEARNLRDKQQMAEQVILRRIEDTEYLIEGASPHFIADK